MGTDKTLGTNEVMVYSNRKAFHYDTLKVFDKQYDVKEKLGQAIENGIIASDELNSYMVVVPDIEEINQLYKLQKRELGDLASNICYFYGFNSDAGKTEQKEFY